jgi:aldose 1-epimerase
MIQLQDGDLAAQVDPSYGNRVRSLRLGGQEFMWTTTERGKLDGVPLLAPWANRIDGLEYFANGKKYLLNPSLENLRFDGNHLPIHGLVLFADAWKTVARDASFVTSRLEFWKRPDWMAQFPFAHTIEMTHWLRNGALEVETAIENLSEQPMPVAIGFHPYFQLTDSPRDEWHVQISARRQVVLSEKLTPTGETKALDFANPLLLKGQALDTVFDDLTGDAFLIEGRRQRIEVRFGPKFPVAIVYAPPTGSFVCIEPMSALTNAFNLDHAGIPSYLQHIAPGGAWRESFWIKPILG